MKRISFLIVLIAGMSNLSMYSDRYATVLDSSDYNWERVDAASGESALSAPSIDGEPAWESYNQWQCFPSDGIEMQWHASHLYEFSMDADPEPDSDKVIDDWKKLLEDEGAFCVYAAFLQKLDYLPKDPSLEGSLWITNRLKTRKGYWSFDAEDNYAQTRDSDADEQ
jgi:hypothetical protein